ncbi:MAG: hypothetical protein P8Z00_23670, partial [Anaerolineales bacterium]
IAPLESEITHLVKTADCGIAIPPGQAESLARAISDLKQQENRLDAMGWNGRNQLLEKYSRGHCVDMYEHMLLSLCKNVPASIGTEELAKKVEA